MKTFFAAAMAFAALFTTAVAAQAADDKPKPPAASLEELDKRLAETFTKAKIPGVSVTIIEGGQIVLTKGYGYADLKTKKPVGNLLEEPLEQILGRARGNPVYQAINQGRPELMGLAHGWPEEKFRQMSRTTLPDGRPYENLCIGCDRFHEEVLMPPKLVSLVR